MQKSNDFKNIAIVHVKKSAYRIYFLYMSKCEAKKLMNNSNLIDKKGNLQKINNTMCALCLDKLTEIKA